MSFYGAFYFSYTGNTGGIRTFEATKNGVSGLVHILDDKRIRIENFKYDGKK